MNAKTQPARGMRDFLPADVRRREYVIRVIKEVYERYGFEPLETPAVENIDTLMGKYGEEGNQLIFKILKRGEGEKTGEADLALRYDLTVPLARVVAEYGEKLPKFFKRYQIQPVWRADRPARGRFREFYQCDVDCIGTRSPVVEAEIFAAASDVLTALSFNNFTIRLNHRQVLAGVLEAAGIAQEKHGEALVALDKLDKIGREGVANEMSARNIPEAAGVTLLRFFEALAEIDRRAGLISDEDMDIARRRARTTGNARVPTRSEALNRAALNELVGFIGNNEAGARGVDELRRIVEYAESDGVADRIKIDPSLARGLSYYTGAIMEINVPDLAGSLGGGGRYDNLVGMFSGRDIPACGFSLGLERIIVVMTERGMFPEDLERASADVLVTIWNEDSFRDSLAFASELRRAAPELRVDVYPEADKLGKQLKYASARGVSYVVVIGDDERARGEVALKDLKTGAQETVSREHAAAVLHERLYGQRAIS
jgi:histidyl-tRNA synthetase